MSYGKKHEAEAGEVGTESRVQEGGATGEEVGTTVGGTEGSRLKVWAE
jgi:hypothetical protein